jgi:type I restriction enzyme S subunit
MSSEWKEIKLGEIVHIKGGKRLPKGEVLQNKKNTHPYIRVRDMGSKMLPREGLEYVPDDVFPKISRYIVEENDVIISIVGTVGLVSIIDSFYHKASQTENCAKLSGLDFIDAQFLYYFLISPKGQQEIHTATVGAVQPKLPLYGIENIDLLWPDKAQRLKVVNLLSSLDQKIQLNRQTNQTLEQMAQALFKSWFVDFDPVMDKLLASGKSIPAELQAHADRRKKQLELLKKNGETPNTQKLSPEILALFPEEFEKVDQDVGVNGYVPLGWGVKRLDDILELAYGKSLKKTDRKDGKIPVYGSGGVNGYHNDYLVQGPGIIIGRKGTVGSIYWEDQNFFPIDTVFYVKPNQGIPLEYCFLLLETLGLQDMNTDAAVPGLNRNNVYRLEFCKPEKNILKTFAKIVYDFQMKKNSLNKNITELTTLRDTLLPKLISGELRIPEESVKGKVKMAKGI